MNQRRTNPPLRLTDRGRTLRFWVVVFPIAVVLLALALDLAAAGLCHLVGVPVADR